MIMLYQGSVLVRYSDSMLANCSSSVVSDLSKLDGKIRQRLCWSDTELLAFLDTRTSANTTSPSATTERSTSSMTKLRLEQPCITSLRFFWYHWAFRLFHKFQIGERSFYLAVGKGQTKKQLTQNENIRPPLCVLYHSAR